MEWISNKKQTPKRYGRYLVSDDYSWYVKLINKGVNCDMMKLMMDIAVIKNGRI